MPTLNSAHLRAAEAGDYDAVCALFRGIDEHHAAVEPERFRRFDGPARPRDHYLKLLSDPDGFFFVAERAGELLGFVNGRVDSTKPFPMFVPRTFVRVTNIFVAPTGRGGGLGRAMMERVMEWGGRRGATATRLDVIADNRLAIDFYRRLGFVDLRLTMECSREDLASSAV